MQRLQELRRPDSMDSVVSGASSNEGHSFVAALDAIKANKRCAVCTEAIMDDGFFSGIECATCGLQLHEACRGLARARVCAKPRASSLAVAEDAPAQGGGAVLPRISSPKMVQRHAHVSFRVDTGKYAGLDSLGGENFILFFGAPLAQQPRMPVVGYNDRVPSILVLLARALRERGGLVAEGIFRVSAEGGALNQARDVLNVGLGLEAVNPEASPHVMACLIKDWFRSLPEGGSCLGPMSTANLQLYAKPETALDENLWNLLLFTDSVLPEPNRTTFLWILDMMRVVCENESKNRMNDRAISIVFAPSVWESPKNFPPIQAMNAVKDVAALVSGALGWVRRSRVKRNPFGDS